MLTPSICYSDQWEARSSDDTRMARWRYRAQPGGWLRVDRQTMRHMLNRLAFEAHRNQAELIGTADIAGRAGDGLDAVEPESWMPAHYA